MKLTAGQMVERVQFSRRAPQDDQAGNTAGDWDLSAAFERPAGYIMRPGSEQAFASRLQGRQPVTIFVYFDAETSQVKADSNWRIVDKRDGTVFAIRAAADMDRSRTWMTFVCEAGVEP